MALLRKLARKANIILSRKYRVGQMVNILKAKHSTPDLKISYDPPRIGVFVTAKCNMKCTMCLTHSEVIPDNPFKYKGSPDMSLDMFKDIVNKFQNTTILSFIGNGEPLMNKELFSMLDYAKENKMSCSLFSNGLLVKKYAKQIVESSVTSMNISLNAINPSEFERFTGYHKTVYDNCLLGLKELVNERDKANKQSLKIHASILIDKHNWHTMKDIISFCEDLKIDHVCLSHFMPNCGEGMSAEERCIFEKDTKVLDYCRELAQEEYSIDVSYPLLLDGKDNNRLCTDNIYSMSIDGGGNISGCERQLLNTENNGKYWEKNVFNNHHMQELRSWFIKKEGELPGPCKTCYNNTSCEAISSTAVKKAA